MGGEKTPEEELRQLTGHLEEHPEDTEILRRRAMLFQQTGQYGPALNDWLRVRDLLPDDREAQERIRYLEIILKYTNLDIFSDPNTHHDPWLD